MRIQHWAIGMVMLGSLALLTGCGRADKPKAPPPQVQMAKPPGPPPMAGGQAPMPAVMPMPPGQQRQVTVRVLSRLGPGQERETTTLTINGVTKTIKLDRNNLTQTSVDFQLQAPATYRYVGACRTTYKDRDRQGVGENQITLAGDATYELFMQDAGHDPFTLFMQPANPAPENVQVAIEADFRKIFKDKKRLTIAPGAKANETISRKVEHKILFQVGNDLATEGQAGIPLAVVAAVKARLADSLSRKWTDTTSIAAEVTLDGDRARKYEIVWYDRVRTGTLTYPEHTGNRSLTFELVEASEYEIKALDD